MQQRDLNQLVCCIIVLFSAISAQKYDFDSFSYYAVKLHPSTEHSLHSRATILSADQNHTLIGNIGELKDWFLFASPKHEPVNLEQHEWVHSVRIQTPQRRLFKRKPVFENTWSGDKTVELVGRQSVDDSVYKSLNISDPGFAEQWHLVNRVHIGNDLNLTPVWLQGVTGKGAVVCFIDDGLDFTHEDLKDNFFAEGSYDYNDHVKLPEPRTPEDHHGTRCAGEVAASRNSVCGVGIAWDAKVSGVRILSGDLTEADEAASINYAFHQNHIYSCSWGPADNGRAMDAPPPIVADAFTNGIINGRNGKGSIFVFASGNGGGSMDACNFDGYTNSIYTITVGGLTETNEHPVYSEMCSALLVVAYSSGYGKAIYTSDWKDGCTDRHGGTSAAAPLVSGVLALVLELRPDLTWRDVQHLVVQTAVPISVQDESWMRLSTGRLYSHKYGFGKIDANATVNFARGFENVNPQVHYNSPIIFVDRDIPQSNQTAREDLVSIYTVDTEMIKDFKRLEHVSVTMSVTHERRGDIEVELVSPNGIISVLATRRPYDLDGGGYKNWTFMSVAHWEENPIGDWSIRVFDRANPESRGKLKTWSIQLFGESKTTNLKSVESAHVSPSTHVLPSSAESVAITSSTTSLSISHTPQVINKSGTTTLSIVIPVTVISLGVIIGIFYFMRKRSKTGDRGYEFDVLQDNEAFLDGGDGFLSDEDEDAELNDYEQFVVEDDWEERRFVR